MKNREGNEIVFEQISPNKYRFRILDRNAKDVDYAWGTQTDDVNLDNIIMVDPPGGPAIYVGSSIYLYTNRFEKVSKIYFKNGCIIETTNK